MPTTVRVEDEVKADLDRLQGLVQAESGKRLSHSELLARLVRLGRRHTAELLSQEPRRRPTKEEIRRLLDEVSVHGRGIKADVTKLDEALYGERP